MTCFDTLEASEPGPLAFRLSIEGLESQGPTVKRGSIGRAWLDLFAASPTRQPAGSAAGDRESKAVAETQSPAYPVLP